MSEMPIEITDRGGVVIGATEMNEAFEKELIRHTVYVMLRGPDGKFLLQKRSSEVPNFKGYWDASAGGHIDEGESPRAAAYRELKEELGVQGVELDFVDSFYFESEGDGRSYKYYAHVFKGVLPPGSLPHGLPSEVESVGVFSRSEIDRLDNIVPIARHIVGLV